MFHVEQRRDINLKDLILQPIVTSYPINDRNFDYNHQELTTIQLIAKLLDTVNKIIEVTNGFDVKLLGKEDSINITNNRKLSPSGNFTGSIMGRLSSLVISEIDSNRDTLKYLINQFSDGQTGYVIDGGFFSSTGISRNYNGGLFPKPIPDDNCCEDIDGGTY